MLKGCFIYLYRFFKFLDSPENSVTLQIASSSKTCVLSFDILLKSPGSISIKVKLDDTKANTIVYDTSETVMEIGKDTATYGIGLPRTWRRITRNLKPDLTKAFEMMDRKRRTKKQVHLRIKEIQSLTLQGMGYIGK